MIHTETNGPGPREAECHVISDANPASEGDARGNRAEFAVGVAAHRRIPVQDEAELVALGHPLRKNVRRLDGAGMTWSQCF